MKLQLLLFLLAVHLGCAAEGTRVQIIAIAAPEQRVTQAALWAAPGDEARLFDEMAGMVAAGEAEILSDCLVTAHHGRAVTAGTTKEFPYATEFDPPGPFGFVVPQSFTFRNLGTSATVRTDTDEGNLAAVKWERSRFHEWLWFKCAEQWPHGRSQQPQFLSESVAGVISSSRKGWQLCGITGEMLPVNTTKPDTARAIIVFARVPRPTADVKSGVSPARLHSITCQLPIAQALPILLRERSNAEELLEESLALVAAGKAVILDHSACAFTERHQAAATGNAEYPWAAAFDGVMQSAFQFTNVGAQLELEPGSGKNKPPVVKHRIVSREVPMVRVSPQPEAAVWLHPVFQSYTVAHAPLPVPGEVLLTRTVLDRNAEGGPAVIVTFLKNAGASHRSSRRRTVHVTLLSLSAADGQKLAALPRDKAVAQLRALVPQTGTLLAWHGAVIPDDVASSVDFLREVPSILGSSVKRLKDSALLSAAPRYFYCRGTLTLSPPADSSPGQLSWSESLNEPGMPTLQDLRTAADRRTDLSEFNRIGTRLVTPLRSTAGDSVLKLAPADVPGGHPEHGRWHSVVQFMRDN